MKIKKYFIINLKKIRKKEEKGRLDKRREEKKVLDIMGIEASKGTTTENTYEDILAKYEVVERLPNEMQILKEKSSNKFVAMKEFNLTDEIEFQKVYNNYS